MFNLNKNSIFLLIIISIPLITLFLGFTFNEDLSTGGSRWDFNLTWPVVVNYSNFNFYGSEISILILFYNNQQIQLI